MKLTPEMVLQIFKRITDDDVHISSKFYNICINLSDRLSYIVLLLEERQNEKTNNIFGLYCFVWKKDYDILLFIFE